MDLREKRRDEIEKNNCFLVKNIKKFKGEKNEKKYCIISFDYGV